MELYARDALTHQLVPRLVGLDLARQRTVPVEHEDDQPVLLLTGHHGTGKTAVLDLLATRYAGRVPVGRADLAGRVPEAANTSGVVDVLTQLVEGLAPAVPRFGRRHFPRLLPGLLAVSSWHRGSTLEQTLARARVARLLIACGLLKTDGEEEPETVGARWTADFAAQLATTEQAGDLEPVAELIVRTYLARHAGRSEGKSVRAWYQDRVGPADGGVEALVRLCLRFHRGGDFRQAVEGVLVAAFLEDLADAHGRWKRLTGTPRPLVLLDNAHTSPGRELLGMLLEHRATPGRSRTDALVVIAAQLGRDEEHHPDAVHRQLPELAESSGWSRTAWGSPSAGLLTVELPPLGREDLLRLLDGAPHELDPRLPTALHRLTGGHPLGSVVLCDAVLHSSQDGPVQPGRLLELRVPDGRAVTEVLLEWLVPPPRVRDHLVLLSDARDREAADVLATARGPAGAGPHPAAAAARYLARERWSPDGDDAYFVAEPFLRAVLVEELRRTSSDPAEQRDWDELHTILAEHHTLLGHAGQADALRHTLATGDAQSVAGRLAELFENGEATSWLDCLRRVATAPHPPRTGWTDRRQETARGEADRHHADYGDVRRSVNRLLHGLWYLADTVDDAPEELCAGVGAELEFLSMRHPTGHAALSGASHDWPAAARAKRPFPRVTPLAPPTDPPRPPRQE